MTTSNNCASCKYFNPNDDRAPQGGTCLRFPPTPMAVPQQGVIGGGGVAMAAVNPPVALDHTCGEYATALALRSVGTGDDQGAN